MKHERTFQYVVSASFLAFMAPVFGAVTYDVGPGEPYTSIGAVPWSSLSPGDTVRIHYRSTPYAEKVLLSGRGTETEPIRVVGVPGPNGEQPVITGQNATTSANMRYRWQTPEYQQSLGLLSVGYHSSGPKPGYIEVSNLTVRDARPEFKYSAEDGSIQSYNAHACAIHIYAAEHVRFSNMTITNSANGFFAKSGGDASTVTRDITIETSYIYGNGTPNSYSVHNLYTESDGVVIQFNRFGQLALGATGSIIKDRSAGTVIRYNWIPSASRMIDLVEAQDGAPLLVGLPTYRATFVYGNILYTRNDWDMTKPIHYGFDGSPGSTRGGTLYFYNNTFVIARNQTDGWKMSWFDVSTDSEIVDVRNNLVFVAPRTAGSPSIEFDLVYGKGHLNFGTNWISPGWKTNFAGWGALAATITGTQQFLSPATNNPGFVNPAAQDFHLVKGSSAIDKGAGLSPAVSSNMANTVYDVVRQYKANASMEARCIVGAAMDLGAFEFGSASCPALPSSPTSPVHSTTPSDSTPSSTTTTVTFQQGVNGYSGAEDKTISNLYFGNSWNKGVGVNDPSGTTLYLVNQKPASTVESRVLMRFDNILLPAGSVVQGAKLKLNLSTWTSPVGGVLTGYYLVPAWQSQGVDWSRAAAGIDWSAPGASGSGDIIPGKTFQITGLKATGAQTISIDLDANVVQQWCSNPEGNQGVLITIPTNSWRVTGSSSEDSNIQLRPQLTIVYLPPTS